MKCSLCKRDLGKGYAGVIYKINNKYICEDCADKIAKQGGFKKMLEEEPAQQKEETKQPSKEEIEKEMIKRREEYDEKIKELQRKYKDIL